MREEWDFEKNDKLSIHFQEVTSGLKEKVWWICPKCKSSYDMLITKRVNANHNCPFCRGLRVNHTNSLATLNPELASQWHPTTNGKLTPNDVTCNSNKKIWWKCNVHDSHEWETSVSHRSRGYGCPYCAGQKVNHTNNISVTNPDGAVFWNHDKNDVNINSITKGSHSNYWWICNECKYEWYSGVKNFLRSPKCPSCTRNTSYPERLMNAFLRLHNVDFEIEKVFEWLPNKRYDFYIPKYDTIIEVHGIQHYEGGFRETKYQISENDKLKRNYAMKNGIANYIVIDARYSKFDYIIENIKDSDLIKVIIDELYDTASLKEVF